MANGDSEVAALRQRCLELDEAAELIEEYGHPGNLAAVYAELDEAEKQLYAARTVEGWSMN